MASLTFSGNRVSLLTLAGPEVGKARIYIDGNYVREIDARSGTRKYRHVEYLGATSKPGKHTVRVVNNGTTGRPRLCIDGWVVNRG